VEVSAQMPLATADADLDRALHVMFSDKLDIATIQTRQPALYALLAQDWAQEKANDHQIIQLIPAVQKTLDRWVAAGRQTANAPLLSSYHLLTIDKATALLRQSPEACLRFLKGDELTSADRKLLAPFGDRRREVNIDMILGTDGSKSIAPSESRRRVSIPAKLVDTAAKRAGMPRETLNRALLFEGSPAQICNGRIALLWELLALPAKEKLPLLREL
jgi:hypothetical protein